MIHHVRAVRRRPCSLRPHQGAVRAEPSRRARQRLVMNPSQPIQPTPSSQLDILCAGSMHPMIDELIGALERIAGKRVAVRFANSGGVKARVLAGEGADVVITTAAAMDELRRHDKILPETAT